MTLPSAQSSFPELYEQELVGPLFRPWVGPMVEEVGLTVFARLNAMALVSMSAGAKEMSEEKRGRRRPPCRHPPIVQRYPRNVVAP